MADNVFKVMGIKQVLSKDKTRVYTTYYCMRNFSAYEVDNSSYLSGVPCEEIQTTEDFPIQVGDSVVFYYGKARGDWQPVVDFKMVEKAKPEPSGDKKADAPAPPKK